MMYVWYRTCKGVDIIFRAKAHAQCNPVCNCASRDGGESACFEMAESLPEFRCWVCSLSFDAERKFLRHLTTPKHAEMEDILYRTEAMELESSSTPISRADLGGIEPPLSPDIVPSMLSAPGSPVTMGEESVVMELPRLEWESYEDTEFHDPADMASSPSSPTPGRDEEEDDPDRDEEFEPEEDG